MQTSAPTTDPSGIGTGTGTGSARREITGRDLRYVLTLVLAEAPQLTVPDLVQAVEDAGFTMRGRPSKAVSDSLRSEIGRGRVVRVGRGRYATGTTPRSTRSWIRQWVRALQQEPLVSADRPDPGPPPAERRHPSPTS